MTEHAALGLQGQIWITAGERSIGGHGRMQLLALIDELGSISKAAKNMKMSYKAAWDAVDHMNNLAGESLVSRTTGGKGGGSTKLTARGRQLIDNFMRIEQAHQAFLAQLSEQAGGMADDLLMLRRLSMKTSARNQFYGKVLQVEKGAVNDAVELEVTGGYRIWATVTCESTQALGLASGVETFALIKASSIILAADGDNLRLSARNQLTGTISRLQKGAVNSEVVITLAGEQTVAAIVTNDSVTALGLAEGKQATAVFKASSVILATPL
ncbi:TOBE domain-containing protein [Pseudomonas sp. F1_0610]|uniref:TOBE domain-containing protein n=1 Tax=Pseudomonas sp. F1_0610 TaxID=3114284 RepID=UPI0039C0DB7D